MVLTSYYTEMSKASLEAHKRRNYRSYSVSCVITAGTRMWWQSGTERQPSNLGGPSSAKACVLRLLIAVSVVINASFTMSWL